MSFCARGTRSSGISRPRSPRATITRVARRENLVEVLERLRPLELRDQRHVAGVGVGHQLRAPAAGRSAVCTKLSATMSTPSDRPNFRSSTSFGVIADAGSGTPGALMPLCSPISPPSTTVVSISSPSVASTRSSTQAVGEQQPVAGPHAAAPGPSNGRRHAARVRRRSRRWRCADVSPASSVQRPCRRRARRCGSSGRRDPGGSRPRSRRAGRRARMRANVAACDSCVPCEKFSRKMSVPAAIERVEHRVGVAGRADGRDDLRVTHVAVLE